MGRSALKARRLAQASPSRFVRRTRVPRLRTRAAYSPAARVSSQTTSCGATPRGRSLARLAGSVGMARITVPACARACSRAFMGVERSSIAVMVPPGELRIADCGLFRRSEVVTPATVVGDVGGGGEGVGLAQEAFYQLAVGELDGADAQWRGDL